MLMLLFAVTAWAAPTDLPEMSADGNIKWYTIKNVRQQKFATYAGDNATMTQQASASAASFFYFTNSTTEGAVKIHNYSAGDKLCAAYNSWTETGIDWYLNAQSTGVSICTSTGEWNAWNDASGGGQKVEYWSASDAGSAWAIELVTDFTSVIDVPAAKTAAKAELENLATVSVIYPAATTDAVAAIEAVTAAGTGLAELNAAIEAINKIVADYKTNAYKALSGKYYTINTPARGNGYLQMTASKVIGTASAATPANIWQFVENNGVVNVYNPFMGLYMCEPQGSSEEIAVTANQADAGAYHLVVNAGAENGAAKIKFTSNGKSVHMDGGATLVRWDNGGASEFTVTLVEDFSTIISNYKNSTIATLDAWATLSVVFDTELVENAKVAINAINTNSYATFAELDAALTNVTDAVAAKMFTFRNDEQDVNHARYATYLSVNASTKKGCGSKVFDYNAVWSLRHASGTSFYLYNELNEVYLANPSNGGLTTDATAAYSFEIVDAATNKAELKCGNETLHLAGSLGLMNYDNNDNASRWIIETIDVTADIKNILDDLTEEDYADVPALGQYTTAAYEALVAARTNAKTVEEVSAAITAFKKAKNRPVFTISGTKDYVVGKSLYEDEGNTNAKGNDCYFKTTNKYDKTMWWAFDQTATTVGVTESVAVVNYATGNPIWGVENLKITETRENIADDGIFLFYTVGNNTSLHFQADGAVLTRWNSDEANSGSAVTFTYVGNTYDLDQLTDEKIAALVSLQAAYDSKALYASAVMGEGLGQYKGDKDAIVTALTAAEAIGSKTLAQQATLNVSDINAATTALNNVAGLTINMPAAGKYYRIQGACEASLPGYYITGHTNEDGGRIALTADADASTIYYFDGTNLVAYQSGLVVGLNDSNWTFASTDDDSKPASTITFAQSPRTTGAYTVKSANRYFHYTVYNETVQINRCADDVCKEHDWYLTEVTELPVTVTAAGYATFFAPVAVELAKGVTAHTVTVDGETAVLSEPMTVVPANTGVVLAGEAGAYNFTIITAAAFEGENLMDGTVAKTVITKAAGKEYYVLANDDEEGVGMYVATNGEEATNVFTNGSHKAFLVVEGAAGVKSFGFQFPGTTGIENVVVENGVNVIFDLTGRKVESISAPGIYIVNGKKVLVK